MLLSRDPVAAISIRQVEPGRIVIGDAHHERSVALTAEGVVAEWTPPAVTELTVDQLAPLLDESPEMLIVGTGWSPAQPRRDLVFALARRGIGLEVMDTPAACRTFNILIAEGRRPAAILTIDG